MFRAFLFLSALVIIAPANASASDEQPMNGAQITAALTDVFVVGEKFSQSFSADGSTLYEEGGNQSPGTWRVTGDQYCSQWPPSEAWDCYHMTSWVEADKTYVVWIGPDGTRWVGYVKP